MKRLVKKNMMSLEEAIEYIKINNNYKEAVQCLNKCGLPLGVCKELSVIILSENEPKKLSDLAIKTRIDIRERKKMIYEKFQKMKISI